MSDRVSDELTKLAEALHEHQKLKWSTPSKLDGNTYQMVPAELISEVTTALGYLSTLRAQGITKPDDGRVLVKPLEWREGIPGRWRADIYMVDRVYLDDYAWYVWNDGALNARAGQLSLTEAKAAAQADYEQRILSALHSPSPRSQGDVE